MKKVNQSSEVDGIDRKNERRKTYQKVGGIRRCVRYMRRWTERIKQFAERRGLSFQDSKRRASNRSV